MQGMPSSGLRRMEWVIYRVYVLLAFRWIGAGLERWSVFELENGMLSLSSLRVTGIVAAMRLSQRNSACATMVL